MLTTIVTFALPQPLSRKEAAATFESTAPEYRDIPGLLRKYYLLSDDRQSVKGVYLWASRADAERQYTQEWKAFVTQKYGIEPSIEYFDTPVVVDNRSGEIMTG